MSDQADRDPRCPECGGPIGATATYCMHCSADLTDEQARADVDGDQAWETEPSTSGTPEQTGHTAVRDGLVAPDGLLDDSLTIVVGIIAGIVVGIVGLLVLLGVTESIWALPIGVGAWLVVTAYLVRRRTVQGAVAHGAYAIAVALALVPLVAFGPSGGSDLSARLEGFVVILLVVAIPAGAVAAVGFVASRFVPEN